MCQKSPREIPEFDLLFRFPHLQPMPPPPLCEPALCDRFIELLRDVSLAKALVDTASAMINMMIRMSGSVFCVSLLPITTSRRECGRLPTVASRMRSDSLDGCTPQPATAAESQNRSLRAARHHHACYSAPTMSPFCARRVPTPSMTLSTNCSPAACRVCRGRVAAHNATPTQIRPPRFWCGSVRGVSLNSAAIAPHRSGRYEPEHFLQKALTV